MGPTETTGPVPNETRVRSCSVDISKDLNTRRTFVQVAAENPRAFLNGMSWNPATVQQPVPTRSQHLIIGDDLIKDLTEILVVGQTTACSFYGASNGMVTRCNTMIRNLIAKSPNELRLIDIESALRMVDHNALTRDGIHFITQQGRKWIKDAFQTKIEAE